MVIIQQELGIKTRKPSAERAAEDALRLVAALRINPGLCGLPADRVSRCLGWNDRRLRAAAEASDGAVLSAPGCTGYRLAERVSVQDYNATERARYLSQIRLMQARLCAMDRAVHGHAARAAQKGASL